MSVNRTRIDATPEQVWAVLADADNYARWVVGARDIRDADETFPAVGTKFHHTQGLGPIDLRDSSEVLVSEPPHHLKLHVMARPMLRAHVDLVLTPDGDATTVEMHEKPVSPVQRLLHNPLTDLVLRGRNVESLRRLKALAEGREPEPTTSRNSGQDAGGGEDGPAVGPEA